MLRENNQNPNIQVYLLCTGNNTILTARCYGLTLCTLSAGRLGLRGARRGTTFASELVGRRMAQSVISVMPQAESVQVIFRGTWASVSASLFGLRAGGLKITSLVDGSRRPHNGCRLRKVRRVL